jgi:hypothetical protein
MGWGEGLAPLPDGDYDHRDHHDDDRNGLTLDQGIGVHEEI